MKKQLLAFLLLCSVGGMQAMEQGITESEALVEPQDNKQQDMTDVEWMIKELKNEALEKLRNNDPQYFDKMLRGKTEKAYVEKYGIEFVYAKFIAEVYPNEKDYILFLLKCYKTNCNENTQYCFKRLKPYFDNFYNHGKLIDLKKIHEFDKASNWIKTSKHKQHTMF